MCGRNQSARHYVECQALKGETDLVWLQSEKEEVDVGILVGIVLALAGQDGQDRPAAQDDVAPVH